MKNVSSVTNSATTSLLDTDKDFCITPVAGKYADRESVAVTWRWPRLKDGQATSVVSTTTVNTLKMQKMRVEEIDNQFFLINDPVGYEQEVRLCVENERVGIEIIRALLDFAKSDGEKLNIPAKLRHWNKVAEHLLPLACSTFCVSISLAAFVWVLFV